MMEVNCVDAERIGNVLEYPADHPVRRHLDSCARCRVLVESYRAFLEVEPVPNASLSKARSALDASIARGAETAFPATARAPFRVSPRGRFSAWLRPIPALATVAVVIAAVVALWPRSEPTSQLREGGPGAETWRLSASARSDGSVELSWEPVAGADAYEICFYGPELDELARLAAVEPSLVIQPATLQTNLPPGSALTWRVRALHGGDVVGISPPSSLRLP